MQLPRGAGILIDHRQRAAKDFRSRAVVLHQPDAAQAGKILTEPFKAACLRAPKAVNRLIRVPDDKEAASLPVPGPDQPGIGGRCCPETHRPADAGTACPAFLPSRPAAAPRAAGRRSRAGRFPSGARRSRPEAPGTAPRGAAGRFSAGETSRRRAAAGNLFIQRAQRLPGKGKSLRFPEQPDLSEQCKADRMEGSDGDPFRGTLSQRGLQPSAQLFRARGW